MNPFHNGQGVLPMAKFSGRRDLLRLLTSMIEAGRFAYLIEGDRGFGKTSLRSWITMHYSRDPSVIVCSLDMADFQPSSSAAGYEEFINRLATAFRESVALKNRRAEIEAKVKDIFKRLRFKLPMGFGEIDTAPAQARQPGIRDFLQAINESAEGNEIRRVLFVFDEISSRQSTPEAANAQWAWQFCADFVSQLVHLPGQNADVALGVILLTYPHDINRVPIEYAPDRHFSGRYSLDPFDLTEVQQLVLDLCRQEDVTYDAEFPRVVYMLSGGIPDLIQSIGYGAYCRSAEVTTGGNVKLSDIHALFAHVSHPAVIEKAVAFVRWKIPELQEWLKVGTPETGELRQALKNLGMLEMKASHSLARADWLKVAAQPGAIDSRRVEGFLNRAIGSGLMISSEDSVDKYRFVGEVLRLALGIIASR